MYLFLNGDAVSYFVRNDGLIFFSFFIKFPQVFYISSLSFSNNLNPNLCSYYYRIIELRILVNKFKNRRSFFTRLSPLKALSLLIYIKFPIRSKRDSLPFFSTHFNLSSLFPPVHSHPFPDPLE